MKSEIWGIVFVIFLICIPVLLAIYYEGIKPKIKQKKVEKRIETKKYKILEPIVLGFLGQYDTQDRMVSSKDGYLKFDHKDVIFVDNNGVEEVSITTNNVIDIWLIQNKIQEFGVDDGNV